MTDPTREHYGSLARAELLNALERYVRRCGGSMDIESMVAVWLETLETTSRAMRGAGEILHDEIAHVPRNPA